MNPKPDEAGNTDENKTDEPTSIDPAPLRGRERWEEDFLDVASTSQKDNFGIEVSEETLSIETMREVCLSGPGHYLGHGQTLDLMQRDYFYPDLANRFSPKEWAEKGKPDIVQLAVERKREVLDGFFPKLIDGETDKWLRERFVIHLPKEHIRTG